MKCLLYFIFYCLLILFVTSKSFDQRIIYPRYYGGLSLNQIRAQSRPINYYENYLEGMRHGKMVASKCGTLHPCIKARKNDKYANDLLFNIYPRPLMRNFKSRNVNPNLNGYILREVHPMFFNYQYKTSVKPLHNIHSTFYPRYVFVLPKKSIPIQCEKNRFIQNHQPMNIQCERSSRNSPIVRLTSTSSTTTVQNFHFKPYYQASTTPFIQPNIAIEQQPTTRSYAPFASSESKIYSVFTIGDAITTMPYRNTSKLNQNQSKVINDFNIHPTELINYQKYVTYSPTISIPYSSSNPTEITKQVEIFSDIFGITERVPTTAQLFETSTPIITTTKRAHIHFNRKNKTYFMQSNLNGTRTTKNKKFTFRYAVTSSEKPPTHFPSFQEIASTNILSYSTNLAINTTLPTFISSSASDHLTPKLIRTHHNTFSGKKTRKFFQNLNKSNSTIRTETSTIHSPSRRKFHNYTSTRKIKSYSDLRFPKKIPLHKLRQKENEVNELKNNFVKEKCISDCYQQINTTTQNSILSTTKSRLKTSTVAAMEGYKSNRHRVKSSNYNNKTTLSPSTSIVNHVQRRPKQQSVESAIMKINNYKETLNNDSTIPIQRSTRYYPQLPIEIYFKNSKLD